MAIRGFDASAFEATLREHVSPSSPIESFENLVDRESQMNSVEEAIASPGRHVFIYGDRGAGKTSLAHTVAFKHESSHRVPVFCACGRQTTFASIVRDVTEQLIGRSRVTATETTRDVGVAGGPFTAKYSVKESARASADDGIDLNAAASMLMEASRGHPSRRIVVIDEFENLPTADDRRLFAELVKQLSDRAAPVALVFCGVGESLDDLLEGHTSAHRYIEGVRVPVPPLSFHGREAIISKAAAAFGIDVHDDVVLRVGRVSDGFPHYIHLICQKMFWIAHRAPGFVDGIDLPLYKAAVAEAVESVEAHLRRSYDRAVKKDLDEYRDILWAVADGFDMERNTQRIYHESYVKLMTNQRRIPLDFAQYAQRLARLRSDPHGHILSSERRSWVRFRESIMRGYVRLVAETSGVPLAL